MVGPWWLVAASMVAVDSAEHWPGTIDDGEEMPMLMHINKQINKYK